MANTLISLRAPKIMLEESNKIIEEEGYTNMQEFIRESWRQAIKKHKVKKALLELENLKGTGKKNYRPKSKKELEEHVKKKF